MTYNEFIDGDYIRDIAGYEGLYQITNKGRVFSIKTQQFIGFRVNGTFIIQIYNKGKNKRLNVAKLLLEAFPDVEFEASTVQSLRGNGKKSSTKPRGVYLNPNYVENKRPSWYSKENLDYLCEMRDLNFKWEDITILFNIKYNENKSLHTLTEVFHKFKQRIKKGKVTQYKSHKYRAVIKFKNTCISLGYTHTVEEAQELYYKAFLKLRGFRPWD